MVSSKITRAIALMLCLILCVLALPACKTKHDPLAPLGFSKFEIDAKGERVHATLRLDARTLQNHAGEWIFLYELLPGETTETAKGVLPISSAKISSAVDFSFDLLDGERSRLYSTFVVGFEDGSVLSHDGYAIENPEVLAKASAPFLWTGSPQGLLVDDVENAASLHTSHAALELSLSTLLGGSDPFTLGGVIYTYNESALKALDGMVRTATESGMQTSLRLLLDKTVDEKTFAALLTLLCSRYNGEDCGILSSILLHANDLTPETASDSAAVARMASLCRIADLALRSHVSNGRVYVHSDLSMTDTRAFFTALQAAISLGGSFDWGMSVLAETPFPENPPHHEPTSEDAITTENLDELNDLLTTSARRGAAWLSVDLVPIQSLDPDLQAAAYAYHYLAAAQAKPSAIFYLSHLDSPDGYDQNGLYGADGYARPFTSVYNSIDSGLSESDLALCRAAWGTNWTAELEAIRSAKRVSGSAGIGIGGIGEQSLFDFGENNAHGFSAISSLSGVTLRDSAAQGAPALMLWADPSQSTLHGIDMRHASGIRKTLLSGAAFKDALSISAHFLAQTNTSDTCTLRLTLVGVAPNGSKVIYESDASVQSGSWQTATFQISQFVLDADLSAPVSLSLTVENGQASEEPYPLWFGSILIRTPERGGFDPTPLILILGGAALGCVGVLLLYRCATARTESKRRRAARRGRR